MSGWHALPAARFTCPLPPSVNNLFFNSMRGRRKSEQYKRWRHDAGWAIKLQDVRPVPGRVRVWIETQMPKRRDLDNAIKGPLDLVVSLGIIEDDNLVDDLRIVRVQGRSDMQISIWQLGD